MPRNESPRRRKGNPVSEYCSQCQAISQSTGRQCHNLAQCRVADTRLSATLCNIHAQEFSKNGWKTLRLVKHNLQDVVANRRLVQEELIPNSDAIESDRLVLLNIAASLKQIDARLGNLESKETKPFFGIAGLSGFSQQQQQPFPPIKQEQSAIKTENDQIEPDKSDQQQQPFASENEFDRIEMQQPIAEKLEGTARLISAEIAVTRALVIRWCGKDKEKADKIAEPVYAYAKRLETLLQEARAEALRETPNLIPFVGENDTLLDEFERDVTKMRTALGKLCSTNQFSLGVPISFAVKLARGQIRCNQRAIPKSIRDWVLRGNVSGSEEDEWTDRKLVCTLRDLLPKARKESANDATSETASEATDSEQSDEENSAKQSTEESEAVTSITVGPFQQGQKLANNYEVYRARTDLAAIGKRRSKNEEYDDNGLPIAADLNEIDSVADDMEKFGVADSEAALVAYLEWLQALSALIDLKLALGGDPASLQFEKVAVSVQIVNTALSLGKDVARKYLSNEMFLRLVNDARLVTSYAEYLQEPLGVTGLATLVAYDVYKRYAGTVDEKTLADISRTAFLNALPSLALLGGSLLGVAVWLNTTAQPKTVNTVSSPTPEKVPIYETGQSATKALQKALQSPEPRYRQMFDRYRLLPTYEERRREREQMRAEQQKQLPPFISNECEWFGNCGGGTLTDDGSDNEKEFWRNVLADCNQGEGGCIGIERTYETRPENRVLPYGSNLSKSSAIAQVLRLGRTRAEQVQHRAWQMRNTVRALNSTNAAQSSSVAAVQMLPEAIASPGYIQFYPRTRAEWLAALDPPAGNSTTLPLLSPASAEMQRIFRQVAADQQQRAQNIERGRLGNRQRERPGSTQTTRTGLGTLSSQRPGLPLGTSVPLPRLGSTGTVFGPAPDTLLDNTALLPLIAQVIQGAPDARVESVGPDLRQFLQREQSAFIDAFAPQNAPMQHQNRNAPDPFAVPLDTPENTEAQLRDGLTLARQFQLEQSIPSRNESLREPERAAQIRVAVQRAQDSLRDEPAAYFDFATPTLEEAADRASGLPLESSTISGLLRTLSGAGLGSVSASDLATTQAGFDPLLFDVPMGGNKTALDEFLRDRFALLDAQGSVARAAARDASALLVYAGDAGRLSERWVVAQLEQLRRAGGSKEVRALLNNAASLHGFLIARYEHLLQQTASGSRRFGQLAEETSSQVRRAVSEARVPETPRTGIQRTRVRDALKTAAVATGQVALDQLQKRTVAAVENAEQLLTQTLPANAAWVRDRLWRPASDAVLETVQSTGKYIGDNYNTASKQIGEFVDTTTQETLPAVQRTLDEQVLPALKRDFSRRLDDTTDTVEQIFRVASDQIEKSGAIPAAQRATSRAIDALKTRMQLEILPEVRAQLERDHGTLEAQVDATLVQNDGQQPFWMTQIATADSFEAQSTEKSNLAWTKRQFEANERAAYERALAAQSEQDQAKREARERRNLRRYLAEQRRAVALAAYVAPNEEFSRSAPPTTVGELVADAENQVAASTNDTVSVEQIQNEFSKQSTNISEAYNDANDAAVQRDGGTEASQTEIAESVAPTLEELGFVWSRIKRLQWRYCMAGKALENANMVERFVVMTDVKSSANLANGLACGREVNLAASDVERLVKRYADAAEYFSEDADEESLELPPFPDNSEQRETQGDSNPVKADKSVDQVKVESQNRAASTRI